MERVMNVTLFTITYFSQDPRDFPNKNKTRSRNHFNNFILVFAIIYIQYCEIGGPTLISLFLLD